MAEIKEYELPGVKSYDIVVRPDERGFFGEAMRQDWVELLGEDTIVQTNVSYSYPGIIRGWHRHLRGQVDYFLVLQGALKICAYDDRKESATRNKLVALTASARKLQIIRIPGFYWHGTMAVSSEPALTIYFATRLYDSLNPDEDRRPWNDPSILDTRTGKPYDWNAPPHK